MNNILSRYFITTKKFQATIDEMVAKELERQRAELAEDDPSMLESAKFARVYNKGTAKEMLETIRLNARDAERNSKLALYVSIPHQALFLLSIVPLKFGNLIQVLESLCLLGVSVVLPYLGDRAILMSVRNLATRVISTWDKVKAFGALLPVTAVSVYLNVMAPGPDLLKYACGVLVAYVPLYQILRTVRPSFKKAGADETKIREEVAGLSEATAKSNIDYSARGQKSAVTRATNKAKKIEEARQAAIAAAEAEAEAARLEEQRKEANRQRGLAAAATRAQRKAEAERAAAEAAAAAKRSRSRKSPTPVQEIQGLPVNAPVSPAPVGR